MKQCKECINYVKHFYIDYNFNLVALNCGHCMLENNMRTKSCINFQKSTRHNPSNIPLGNIMHKLISYTYDANSLLEELSQDIQNLAK